ncbi:MAG: 30S ribosome-binding factor RbfA [Patescibacteria group bacterium]
MRQQRPSSPYRGQQIAEVIHRTIGQAFLKEIEVPFGSFVTISKVELDPERKHAKIFLTVLPDGVALSTFRAIKNQTGTAQHKLNTTLRTRPVPKIAFLLDKGEEKRHRMDEILDQIDFPA